MEGYNREKPGDGGHGRVVMKRDAGNYSAYMQDVKWLLFPDSSSKFSTGLHC